MSPIFQWPEKCVTFNMSSVLFKFEENTDMHECSGNSRWLLVIAKTNRFHRFPRRFNSLPKSRSLEVSLLN